MGTALQTQTFDASGSFVVPDEVSCLFIAAMVAGGGGGGGGYGYLNIIGGISGAPGAGSGELVQNYVVPVTPGQTVDIVVGAGGVHGIGGSEPARPVRTAGTAGGDSSVDSGQGPGIVIARGGHLGPTTFNATIGADGAYGGGSGGGSGGLEGNANFPGRPGSMESWCQVGGAGGAGSINTSKAGGAQPYAGGVHGTGGTKNGGGGGGSSLFGQGGHGGNVSAGEPAAVAVPVTNRGAGGGGGGSTFAPSYPYYDGADGVAGRVIIAWIA